MEWIFWLLCFCAIWLFVRGADERVCKCEPSDTCEGCAVESEEK